MKFNKTAIRSISATLVLAQLSLAMQPLMAATREDKGASSPMAQAQLKQMQALQRSMDEGKAAQAAAALSPADRASTNLARVEELVRDLRYLGEEGDEAGAATKSGQEQVRAIGQTTKAKVRSLTAEQKLQRESRRTALWSELKSLLAQQGQDQGAVRSEFGQTRKMLIERKLPAVILARHDEAVAKFEQRVAQFNQAATKAASGDEAALAQLTAFFDENPTKRRAAPVDPKNLPWRTPEPTKRMPAETQTAWFQNLYGREGTRLAQVGNSLAGLTFITPPDAGSAPTEADLAETPETQRTAAIVAKATELGNNPVAIQNWVRNNVEWVPTWGAIQSAEDTLNKKRGNAIDIASLEIALLRAAKIPARYQFGTIELPAEQVMNWVGGVSKPEAAQQLLGQGGIANRGLIEGGKISKIRMEHAWVQAYVNWVPSRGAKQGSASQHPNPLAQRNAWVTLDPSFKQYKYKEIPAFEAQVPFDLASAAAAAQQDATANEDEGWVENIGRSAIESRYQSYRDSLATYLKQSAPELTAGTPLRAVIAQNVSLLPGAYPLAVSSSSAAAVPEGLKWKIELRAYASEMDRAERFTAFSKVFALTELTGKRVSAKGVPATATDAQTLAQLVAGGGAKLSIYLIQMKTEVAVDDAVVGTLPARPMGSDLYWGYVLTSPTLGTFDEDFALSGAVGDQSVFSVNPSGLSDVDVAKRYKAVSPNTPLENLNQVALGYWARADVSDSVMAAMKGVVVHRMPSVGMVAQPLRVVYSWGVPRLGSYKSYAIDVRRLSLTAASKNAAGLPVDFVISTGHKNSYLEGRVFEEVFDYANENGISAVSILNQNVKSGAPLWTLGSGNLSAWSGKSLLSADDKRRIADYVNQGYTVVASEERADFGFWRGTGFIATDPATGSGAYIVSSGLNGGEFEACEEKREPITQVVKDVVQTFLVLALVALIAAGIVGTVGVATPVIIAAMRIVGVTALTWTSTSYAAGACPSSEKCHRGVLQAQGNDIRGGSGNGTGRTRSVPWAKATPLTLAEGLTKLEQLKALLNPSELADRVTYFAAAEAYMMNASRGGGVCAGPTSSPSFGPNPNNKDHVKKAIRVDIAVKAGLAFTP